MLKARSPVTRNAVPKNEMSASALTATRHLLCEELAHIRKCLELQRIARGIEKEHGGLLAHLALESNVGFDDELDAGCSKSIGERLPVLHRKDDTEVGNGNVVPVDRIVMRVVAVRSRLQMRDDLVSEEVEVDPLCGTTSFRTAECPTVKCARGIQVIHGKGNMKRGKRHDCLLR